MKGRFSYSTSHFDFEVKVIIKVKVIIGGHDKVEVEVGDNFKVKVES
jgi:hypothetical protein